MSHTQSHNSSNNNSTDISSTTLSKPNLHIRTKSDSSTTDSLSIKTPRSQNQTPSHYNALKNNNNINTTQQHIHNDLHSPISPTSKRSNALLAKLKQQMHNTAKEVENTTLSVLHTADNTLRGIDTSHKILMEDAMLETLDYDDTSGIQQQQQHNNNTNNLAYSNNKMKQRKLNRISIFMCQLILTMLIAFITSICMYIVSSIITFFVSNRVNVVMNLLENEQNDAAAYFVKIAVSLAYCLISACMVAIIASDARGSGVPFCMAYLNGTNVNQFFKLRILIVKVFSLAFTIASGLTLGKEGPFVHIGACISYVLLYSISLIDRITFYYFTSYIQYIRSIHEERIYMCGGMAAGLTVAFEAPIAGILFALEGSTSFITVPVLIRIFGCAMFAEFFNDWMKSGWSNYILNHNLINKTRDESLQPYAWQFQEIIIYLWLAVLCGTFAAIITRLNVRLTKYRHHHMLNNTWRGIGKNIGEVCFWTFLTATIWFIIPYMFSCRPVINACNTNTEVVMCRQAHCQKGYWSELGSIVYATPDGIARLMLDRSISYNDDYHTVPLMLYAIIYFILVGCQYGIYTPGGLFVPAVVAGAVIGRCHGIWLNVIFPFWSINTGVYGMLGAAAMLGGFNRLVLPIILMVIEMTGDSTYLLPIMICGSVAKLFADWLEPPLYPQHMILEGIPQLNDKINTAIAKLKACDIMKPASQISYIKPIDTIQNITNVLQASQRVTFPVLNHKKQFIGMINRRAIMYAIQYNTTYDTEDDAVNNIQHNNSSNIHSNKMIDWHDTTDYAHTLNTITNIKDITSKHYTNLMSFVDTGVITAHSQTPTKRILSLFRRVGVSHCCVTDNHNVFLGIITRRNLLSPPGSNTNANHDTHSNHHDNDAHNTNNHQQLTSVSEDNETQDDDDDQEPESADDFVHISASTTNVYDDDNEQYNTNKSNLSTPRKRTPNSRTPTASTSSQQQSYTNLFDHV